MSTAVNTGIHMALNLYRCFHTDCECRVALTPTHESNLRARGGAFWCPAGHQCTFGKGEVERLKEQLDAANARATRGWEEATKAGRKLKRVESRVARGVCPWCNRTFENVASHVKTKHPQHCKP